MTLWGRRLLLFVLVLGIGLVIANRARRLTAHASPRPAAGRIAAPVDTGSAAGTATAGKDSPNIAGEPARVAGPAESSRIMAHPAAATKPAGAGAAALVARPGATRTFHDRSFKVSFDFPANWTFSERDHEISTFRLDARSADKKTVLRAVTALPENPYPASTFTGAYVYLSVTPHTNESRCEQQAAPERSSKKEVSQIAGLNFAHGHNEQKQICTVERDEIFTTYRKGACYRFDLAMNNFCGGEVSGVKDVTEQELDTVLSRMESIMGTVRFDGK